MIVAGIDEAGYGPVLGPMVIGCAAICLPDDAPTNRVQLGGSPCAWKLLRRAISRTRDASGKRLHVNDSKKVYSPASGLRELERSVLCLSSVLHGASGDLSTLLGHCAPESATALDEIDWYQAALDDAFPIEHEAVAIRIGANALRHEMSRGGCALTMLGAHVLPECRLNRMFDQTQNKSSTSFTFVARHVEALLEAHAHGRLLIVIDRQGGRTRYGELLRQMFGAWEIETIDEKPKRAEYRLVDGARSATIVFAEEAEKQCASVAIASMLAKYLREALMRRFNAYWRTHVPAIKPTAGYYGDGGRFLDDLAPKLKELGIERSRLARSR